MSSDPRLHLPGIMTMTKIAILGASRVLAYAASPEEDERLAKVVPHRGWLAAAGPHAAHRGRCSLLGKGKRTHGRYGD